MHVPVAWFATAILSFRDLESRLLFTSQREVFRTVELRIVTYLQFEALDVAMEEGWRCVAIYYLIFLFLVTTRENVERNDTYANSTSNLKSERKAKAANFLLYTMPEERIEAEPATIRKRIVENVGMRGADHVCCMCAPLIR